MPGTELVLATPRGPRAAAVICERLDPGERRLAAVAAAHEHDAGALAELALGYLLTHGRASAHTQRAYRHAITRLVRAWRDSGTNLLRPAADAGDRYLRQLEVRLTAATVRVHLAGCRALYRMLRATDATRAHPFGDARVVKPDARPAHDRRAAFPETELARMLAVAEPVDQVLILLGARGGLRLAEALALEWTDIALADALPSLCVRHGKGGVTRDVALAQELARTLRIARELQLANPVVEQRKSPYVLPYRSPTRARQRLRRVQQHAKVTVRPGRSVHALRHTAGTAVYRATRDLVAVQAWLGHASINTSRLYVHRVANEDAAHIASHLPPIARPAPPDPA